VFGTSGLLIYCDDTIKNRRQVYGELYEVGKSTLGKHRFTELKKKSA
jgi:hypothetical protein